MISFEICQLCQKKIRSENMEIHHYIPQCEGGTPNDTLRLCGTCHDVIHYYIDIKDISKYKTYESFLTIFGITTYINWIKDKNSTGKWKIKKVLRQMTN